MKLLYLLLLLPIPLFGQSPKVDVQEKVLAPYQTTTARISVSNPMEGMTIRIFKKDPQKAIGFRDTIIALQAEDIKEGREYVISRTIIAYKLAIYKKTYAIAVETQYPRPAAFISGFKYNDLNNNGRWDPNPPEGEPELPLPDVEVCLDGPGMERRVVCTRTDRHGKFVFPLDKLGPCVLWEEVPPGWVATTPRMYQIPADKLVPGGHAEFAFGNRKLPGFKPEKECTLEMAEIPQNGTPIYWENIFPNPVELRRETFSSMAFCAFAKDFDHIFYSCICSDGKKEISRSSEKIQIEDILDYQWEILRETIDGEPVIDEDRRPFDEGTSFLPCTIFYPPFMEDKTTYRAELQVEVNNGLWGESITQNIQITIESRDCNYFWKIDYQLVSEKAPFQPITPAFTDCQPAEKRWKKGEPWEILPQDPIKIVKGDLAVLDFALEDTDELFVGCSGSCGSDARTFSVEDALTYHWDNQGQGYFMGFGRSVTTNGNISSVVYRAPLTPGEYRVKLTITDSGLHGEQEKIDTEIKILVVQDDGTDELDNPTPANPDRLFVQREGESYSASYEDIVQKQSCYCDLLSGLAALVFQPSGSQYLMNNVRHKGGKEYCVNFYRKDYRNPQTPPIREEVCIELPDRLTIGDAGFQKDAADNCYDHWPVIVQRAFMKFDGNRTAFKCGGHPKAEEGTAIWTKTGVLESLTGKTAAHFTVDNVGAAKAYEMIKDAIAHNKLVLVETQGCPTHECFHPHIHHTHSCKLMKSHIYAVKSFELRGQARKTEHMILFNPANYGENEKLKERDQALVAITKDEFAAGFKDFVICDRPD